MREKYAAWHEIGVAAGHLDLHGAVSMPALFSPAWANTLQQTLNASAMYREDAATWEGDILFIAQTEAEPRYVYLDLYHGTCNSALVGSDATTKDPAFTIEAPLDIWYKVLDGSLDSIMGMMLGKLKVRGNLTAIATHGKAAKALVACAALVDRT